MRSGYSVAISDQTYNFAEQYKQALIEGRAAAGEDLQGALADRWIASEELTLELKQYYQDKLKKYLWARAVKSDIPKEIDNRQISRDITSFYPYGGKASYFWQEVEAIYREETEAKSKLQATLEKLSTEEFVALLMSTKRPVLYAENEIYGDGWDWSPAEMHILGDCSVIMPKVRVFDDGAREASKARVHSKGSIEATYIYTPGILLANAYDQLTADMAEVIIEKNDQLIFDEDKFYEIYERRLLPGLLEVNESLKQSNKTGFCNMPGFGAGAFAGQFSKPEIKRQLIKVMEKFIRHHHAKLGNIKAICLDLYDQPIKPIVKPTFGGSHIDFVLAPAGTTGLQQLAAPMSFNPKYRDCVLVSYVAADQVSCPNNEALVGIRAGSDEAVKGACSDSSAILTGEPGTYNQNKKLYETASGRTYKNIIIEKRLVLLPPAKAIKSRQVTLDQKTNSKLYENFIELNNSKIQLHRDREVLKNINQIFSILADKTITDSSLIDISSFYKKYTWITSRDGYVNLNQTIVSLNYNLEKIRAFINHPDIKNCPLVENALIRMVEKIYKQDDVNALQLSENLAKALNKKDMVSVLKEYSETKSQKVIDSIVTDESVLNELYDKINLYINSEALRNQFNLYLTNFLLDKDEKDSGKIITFKDKINSLLSQLTIRKKGSSQDTDVSRMQLTELRAAFDNLMDNINGVTDHPLVTISDETHAFAEQYRQALIKGDAIAGEDFQAALADKWIASAKYRKSYQSSLDEKLWAREAKLVEKDSAGRVVHQSKDNENHTQNKYYPYGGKASQFWEHIARQEDKKTFKSFLETLTTEEFINLLLATKRPVVYAENAVYGDGWDWNSAEMHILAECGFVLPDVSLCDNGYRSGGKDDYKIHDPVKKAIYVYTPALLLANAHSQLTADAAEVVIASQKSPTGFDLDEDAFYAAYEKRLMPALRQVNKMLADNKQQGFINIPGLGSGAFCGKNILESRVKECLINVITKLIRDHHEELSHIKAVCLDLYDTPTGDSVNNKPCRVENYAGSKIDFLLSPASTTHIPRLSTPEMFDSSYQNLNLVPVVIVAADALSLGNNEANSSTISTINRTQSDEAVCGSASNAAEKITGETGAYNKKNRSFLPTVGKSYQEVMTRKNKIFLPGSCHIVKHPTTANDKKHDAVYADFVTLNNKKKTEYSEREIKKFLDQALDLFAKFNPDKKEDKSMTERITSFYEKNTWVSYEGSYQDLNPAVNALKADLTPIDRILSQAKVIHIPLATKVIMSIVKDAYMKDAAADAREQIHNLIVNFNQGFFKDLNQFKGFLDKYTKVNEDIVLSNEAVIATAFNFQQAIDVALNKYFPPNGAILERQQQREEFLAIQGNLKLCLFNFLLDTPPTNEKVIAFKNQSADLITQAKNIFPGEEKTTAKNNRSAELVEFLRRPLLELTGCIAEINNFNQEVSPMLQEVKESLFRADGSIDTSKVLDNFSRQHFSKINPTDIIMNFNDAVYPAVLSFPTDKNFEVPSSLKNLFVMESNGSNRVIIKLTVEGCRQGLLENIFSALRLTEKQSIIMKYLLHRSKNPDEYTHRWSSCLFRSISRNQRLDTAWNTIQCQNTSEDSTITSLKESKNNNYEHWSDVSRELSRKRR